MLDLTFLGALAVPFSALFKAVLVFLAAILGLFGATGCLVLKTEGPPKIVGIRAITSYEVYVEGDKEKESTLSITSPLLNSLLGADEDSDETEDEDAGE